MTRKILAFAIVVGLVAGLVVWAADAADTKTTTTTTTTKTTTTAKADYIGAKKCMPCHMKIYKAWAETRHAHALEGLKATTPEQLKTMNELLKTEVKEKPETDAACVGCHVTGYKLAGGYPAADSARTAAVAFVGCEMCHGPAAAHMAVPMSDKEGRRKTMLVPTAETCKKCHTDAISPKFDFAVMSKKVHPVAVAAPAK